MILERLQVEEGFLNGLDLDFTKGLNVLIGARGTGKTSVIELIRFCLDAKGSISELSRKSTNHALSILGSGKVIVTLRAGEQRIFVSRTASDPVPITNSSYLKPIIFSQTEIENIGLEPTGRLRIIDGFLPHSFKNDIEQKTAIAAITSFTVEMSNVRKELDEMNIILNDYQNIESGLKAVIEKETSLSNESGLIQQQTIQLQKISENISKLATQESTSIEAQNNISQWLHMISPSLNLTFIEQLNSSEYLKKYSNEINSVTNHLHEADQVLRKIWATIDTERQSVASEKIIQESQSRDLRIAIDSLKDGAGQIMREGQELRERKAHLDLIANNFKNKLLKLESLRKSRDANFLALEKIRSIRFSQRQEIIDSLNLKLGPNIQISIRKNSQIENYSTLLSNMLRGSGTRYNDIIPELTTKIMPRVLLEAAENYDIELISNLTNLSSERISRVLNHLRNNDLGSLGSIDLEDDISMKLLDGATYKDITALSTGQRCTVILPIVMSHIERVLIVDQPEDHIDNAFIANILIRALLSRADKSQVIFTTHNPNIPVLGSAKNVIHLASDGKRGYVETKGALNSKAIIQSISTVMEGGAEAFATRSQFYKQNDL